VPYLDAAAVTLDVAATVPAAECVCVLLTHDVAVIDPAAPRRASPVPVTLLAPAAAPDTDRRATADPATPLVAATLLAVGRNTLATPPAEDVAATTPAAVTIGTLA